MSATVNTRTIDWQAIAGTVYGGTLMVNDDGSGTLVVDRAIISKKYSELTSASGTPPAGYSVLSCGTLPSPGDYKKRASTLCNLCSYNDNSSNPNVIRMASSGNYLYLTLPIGLDPDTEVTAVYPLATPITIPLTATQISLLKGQNTLWADTGDVDVEYIATGGEGGKLALLLRNRKELLIALRKGLTPAEAGLLNSTPLLGGFVRPGLSTDDEKEEDELI